MAFVISQPSKKVPSDITLAEALEQIQENIEKSLPNLNVDVNNLFDIICELLIENEELKAELTITKGTENSVGKAGKAKLRKSMATKFKIFIKHFSAKRGEPIKAEEEKDLIDSINKVVERVVPFPKTKK